MHKVAFASIWIFIFTIPWQSVVMVPGIGTFSRALGIPVAAIGLFAVLYSQKIRFHTFHLLMVVFFIWASLTYFWSINQDSSKVAIFTYAQLAVMVWLVYQYSTKVKEVHALMHAFVLGALIAICSTIYSYLSGASVAYQRYAASGFDANDMAVIIALSIPMAWYISLNLENKYAITFYRLFPLAALFGILVTASRAGFIVAMIATTYILTTYYFMSFRSRLFVLLAGIVVVIAAFPYLPIESFARLETIGTSISQADIGSRVAIWQAGLAYLSNSTFFGLGSLWGIGAGSFRYAVVPYLGGEYAPHNVYLSILVELGAIAFLMFLTILMYSVKNAMQMPRLQRNLWLTLLAIWSVAAFTLNIEWRKETWLLFALLTAHTAVMKNAESST